MIDEIVVDRKVLDALKRRSLKHYPKEHVEMLFGVVKNGAAHVHVMGEPSWVRREIDGCEWDGEPEQHAEDLGYTYLGTVHSHPMTSAHPSDTDWKLLRDRCGEEVVDWKRDRCYEYYCDELLIGVCGIRKWRGRRFVSWKFFNKSGDPIELVIAE